MCTISDLERLLVELNNKPVAGEQQSKTVSSAKSTYESVYQMGPLYKNPNIYNKFKFPTDGSAEPQQLTSGMVAKLFREYLTQKNLWPCKELQTADFLTFLAESLDVENPWNIGVKIVSLPLLKSVSWEFNVFFELCQ